MFLSFDLLGETMDPQILVAKVDTDFEVYMSGNFMTDQPKRASDKYTSARRSSDKNIHEHPNQEAKW